MPTFKCGKYLFPIERKTYVMGILNVTPDSFSDGGKFFNTKNAIAHAIAMQNDGADIIDIGAQSTRPGFCKISPEEEWQRLRIILPELTKVLNIPISIDTFYPEVADKALACGVSIVNDINGFKNEKMWNIVSHFFCGCIVVHSGPSNMAKIFFESSLKKAKQYGIALERLCFDPGIGFGKDLKDNIMAIKTLKQQKIASNALLIGASKKSFIGKICNKENPNDRLIGTLATNIVSIINGADIVRVHDVKETVEAIKILDVLL